MSPLRQVATSMKTLVHAEDAFLAVSESIFPELLPPASIVCVVLAIANSLLPLEAESAPAKKS